MARDHEWAKKKLAEAQVTLNKYSSIVATYDRIAAARTRARLERKQFVLLGSMQVRWKADPVAKARDLEWLRTNIKNQDDLKLFDEDFIGVEQTDTSDSVKGADVKVNSRSSKRSAKPAPREPVPATDSAPEKGARSEPSDVTVRSIGSNASGPGLVASGEHPKCDGKEHVADNTSRQGGSLDEGGDSLVGSDDAVATDSSGAGITAAPDGSENDAHVMTQQPASASGSTSVAKERDTGRPSAEASVVVDAERDGAEETNFNLGQKDPSADPVQSGNAEHSAANVDRSSEPTEIIASLLAMPFASAS